MAWGDYKVQDYKVQKVKRIGSYSLFRMVVLLGEESSISASQT